MKSLIKKIICHYHWYPYPFGHTNMPKSRLDFLLNKLKDVLYQDVPGDVLELGVFRGGSLLKMAKVLNDLSPHKTIIGIDTFEGHPYQTKIKEKDGIVHHHKGRYSNTDIMNVNKIFKKNKVINYMLIKGTHDNVPKHRKYCFVHIDVNIYESTKLCIKKVLPLLSEGGIIIFDDYNDTIGATKGIDECLKVIPYIKSQGAYYQKTS